MRYLGGQARETAQVPTCGPGTASAASIWLFGL